MGSQGEETCVKALGLAPVWTVIEIETPLELIIMIGP